MTKQTPGKVSETMAYEGVPPETNTTRASRFASTDSTRPASAQAPKPDIPSERSVTVIDVDHDGNVVKNRRTARGDNTSA